VAATEKDAVCPAVTDIATGCIVIEGPVAAGPVVVVDASPEQPVEKIPSRITNKTKLKTKLKRFMRCLFQEVSPARHLLAKSGRVAGDEEEFSHQPVSGHSARGLIKTIGGRTAGRQLLVRPENGL